MVFKSSTLATGGSSGGTGGGSISSITSSGSTINVTNPTGPTTNIDAKVATASTLGIVQPDNSSISIDAFGIISTKGPAGTVTSVSGVTANGLAFSIANPTTTPAITGKTTITGILQGNGTAISAVASGGISTSLLSSNSVTISGVSGVTGGGTVALGSSITLGMAGNIANSLAGYSSLGVFSDVSVGSNLTLTGGVLRATSSGGSGSPGGADLNVQYNKAGAFGGDNFLGWDYTNGQFFVQAITSGSTPLTLYAYTGGQNVDYFDVINSSSTNIFAVGSDGGLRKIKNVSYVWPAANAPGFFINDGSGNLSWSDLTGDVTTSGSSTTTIISNVNLSGNPTTTTQAASDNSTRIATTAYVTTGISNAIAGVNPAVAVQAATTQASNTSGLTYNNGAGGIGATLTGSINTAITWDGYTFTALGQRGLVKNDTQSPSGARNGVYYVTQVQTAILPPILTRALDYDQPSDINNTGAIPVINGTVNADTSWLLTSQITTVGTDPLTYTQFTVNPTTVMLARIITSISSPSTAGANANTDYVYFVSGTTTITLPTAVSNTNSYSIKNTGNNIVTIATTSSQTIDGSSTASLPVANTSLTLVSAGSNWGII